MSRQEAKPRSEFERKIVLEAPAHFALARRLVDGTLLKEEAVLFARVKRVLELRERGWKLEQIAQEVGVTLTALQKFQNRGRFRVMAQFVRWSATSTDTKVQDERAKGERARFDALGTKALDFLERCFERDPKGEFRSKADARWATQLIAKGKGWDEPQDARRRIGEIKIGVIMAQQAAIRASDEKFHVVVQAEPAPALMAIEAKADELYDFEEGGGAVEEEEVDVQQIPES